MTQSTTQMRAAAIDKFGGPITPHMLPIPRPGPDEILIHVESAGIGVWDPFEAEGGFARMMGMQPSFPYVPGADGAGTVAEVGAGVHDFKKGDKVYAMALANPQGGFYAEYAAVPAAQVSRIPRGLKVDQAGAMPVDAMTALVGLDNILKLRSGESILIFGASGGIGHLAVQLAKRMGARVLAVASGSDGVEFVKGLGADQVIDGRSADIAAVARVFAPRGLDCILLTSGGAAAEKAIESLGQGGRVAYPNGVEPAPKARDGVKMQSYDAMPNEGTAKLNQLIEQGPFTVHIARTFSLDEADGAHKALDQHFLGKLALHPA